MRRLIIAPAIAAAVSLNGCGPAEEPVPAPSNNSAAAAVVAPPPPKPVDYGNRYSAELAGRDADERARLLGQVVRSADERCPAATAAEFKGQDEGQAFWVVSCGGNDFLVSIDRASSTKVLSCELAGKLSLSCRGRW